MGGRFLARAQSERTQANQAVWAALQTQLIALAYGQGELLTHAAQPWSSVTFSGKRHEIELEFKGEAAIEAGEQMIEALPQHEFSIPGHLVADASCREQMHVFGPSPKMKVKCVLLLLVED